MSGPNYVFIGVIGFEIKMLWCKLVPSSYEYFGHLLNSIEKTSQDSDLRSLPPIDVMAKEKSKRMQSSPMCRSFVLPIYQCVSWSFFEGSQRRRKAFFSQPINVELQTMDFL